jgi:hypothetical protein
MTALSFLTARRNDKRTLVVLAGALIACVAFVNIVSVVTSPGVVVVDLSSVGQQQPATMKSNGTGLMMPIMSAKFVRIDPPDDPMSSKVRLVLSVDAGELTDLMDAYERGFRSEPTHYPDDGGIILHNPDLCRRPPPNVDDGQRRPGGPATTDRPSLRWIVFVHSSPGNADRRQLLRDTWANLSLFRNVTFRVVFLIGIPPPDQQRLQPYIKAEFDKYGDIVQGNFIDSYRNLTHKAVLGLRWLSEFCPEPAYAIKADDDTFLNIFEMIPLLEANSGKSNVIICPLWPENAMPILRDPKTCMKWCVKRSELKGRTHFPQYCAGIGYVVSRPLLPLLYNASRSTPFFWIDDVYVTGLLPKKLATKVVYVNTMEHFTAKQDLAVKQYESPDEPIKYFYVHAKDQAIFRRLWEALLKRLTGEQKKMLHSDVLAKLTS